MTNTTAAPSGPPSYGGLQSAHQLPASDGGGVVFPFGFFGPVYYLPEWEFIRYANYVQELRSNIHQQQWWQRLFRRPSLLQRLGIAALILLSLYYLVSSGLLSLQYYLVCMIAGLIFNFYFWMARIHLLHPGRFRERFPAAVQLPLHAHWWMHCLAALVAITRRDYFLLLIRGALWTGFAYVIYRAWSASALYPLLTAAALPAIVVYLCQPVAMLSSFLLLRHRLGRRASPADLHPVDPPP